MVSLRQENKLKDPEYLFKIIMGQCTKAVQHKKLERVMGFTKVMREWEVGALLDILKSVLFYANKRVYLHVQAAKA